MPDYTTHADAIFDPNKPILGSTHLEARDNLIAVADGEPTAPNLLIGVAARTASGVVGTYVFAHREVDANVAFGALVAGSTLRPASAWIGTEGGAGVPNWTSTRFALGSLLNGTWMCMGNYRYRLDIVGTGGVPDRVYAYGATLWMRKL